MELEGFKSAWQNQTVEAHSLPSPIRSSRSLQFLRTSAIRDLQRSEEWSRLIFCLLFGLLAVGVSFKVMPAGAGRIAAWLFAVALLVESVAGMVLLARRFRAPATAAMLEFISREYRQAETRLRYERSIQRLRLVLLAVALLVLLFSPRPIDLRDNSLDALERMAILTAFLAFAWRRAKSRSKEVRRELERYLRDLEA